MAEYIKRESAIEALSRGEGCGNVCRLAIERILAADVAPVRHGRWIDMRESSKDVPECKCSECGCVIIGLEKNYCPNCGARMDATTE